MVLFKTHPQAVIPLRGSYVDVFPFLVFFLISSFALYVLLNKKKVNILRRVVQVISVLLFIYFTSECFCLIRNAVLFGFPLIGREELLSFGYLILSVFIVSITFVFGRIFCGWICPFGFLQEAVYFFNRVISRRLYLPIIMLTFAAGIIYIIFLKPSQDIFFQFLPNFLAMFMLFILFFYVVNNKSELKLRKIRKFIFFFWLLLLLCKIYTFQPWCYLYGLKTGEYGIEGAFIVVLIGALIFYRPYCRFICPVGALLSYSSKWAVFSLDRKECKNCEQCGKVCLSGNIDKGKIKNKGDCILCGQCIEKDGFCFSIIPKEFKP